MEKASPRQELKVAESGADSLILSVSGTEIGVKDGPLRERWQQENAEALVQATQQDHIGDATLTTLVGGRFSEMDPNEIAVSESVEAALKVRRQMERDFYAKAGTLDPARLTLEIAPNALYHTVAAAVLSAAAAGYQRYEMAGRDLVPNDHCDRTNAPRLDADSDEEPCAVLSVQVTHNGWYVRPMRYRNNLPLCGHVPGASADYASPFHSGTLADIRQKVRPTTDTQKPEPFVATEDFAGRILMMPDCPTIARPNVDSLKKLASSFERHMEICEVVEVFGEPATRWASIREAVQIVRNWDPSRHVVLMSPQPAPFSCDAGTFSLSGD